MNHVIVIDRNGTRDILGEGLLWSRREGAVFWTDILAPALNRLSLATGEVHRWPMPEKIGWVIEREDESGFVAGLESGFAELSLTPVTTRHLASPAPHPEGNRLNDAKADRWGRIWAGTMPIEADRPSGNLHMLDTDGRVHLIDTGYTVANGPAISPDHRWLYHTDTPERSVYRFELTERGIDNKSLFIRFEDDWGKPDGMTCDEEGGLWVAHWGGGRVSRFTPQGQVDQTIRLPASQITNMCFAGPNLDRMFVTSAADGREEEPFAGALFEVDPGCRGLEPFRYRA